MTIKDFDFKQFFLEKGERIGLGVCAAFMALLLVGGVIKAVTAGSPSKTAGVVKTKAEGAKQRIDLSRPDPSDFEKDKKELAAQIIFDPIDPDAVRPANDLFVSTSVEDKKRRAPEVLAPVDFTAQVVYAPVRSVILAQSQKNKQIAVLIDKSFGTAGGIPSLNRRAGGKFGQGGGFGAPPPGMGAPPGMGMPGMGGGAPGMGMPGMGRPGGMGSPPPGSDGGGVGGGFSGPGGVDSGTRVYNVEYLDLDKLESRNDIKLAEIVVPTHLVIVTGAFPFKAQWDEFRRAMKKRTLAEVTEMNQNGSAPFDFVGFDVQRRVTAPGGKAGEWEDYTKLRTQYIQYVFQRTPLVDEPEDPKLQNVTFPGLAGWRPPLRDQEYPEVKLKKIEDTLEALAKAGKDAIPVAARPKNKFEGGGGEFNPDNPNVGGADKDAPATKQPTAKPGDKPAEEVADSDSSLPEYALARFIDVSVEPGKTYEYRVKVRMANPNYGKNKEVAYASLAKDKEIKAKEWAPAGKPITIPVAGDNRFYLVDEKPEKGVTLHSATPANRDRVAMQLHRWVASEYPNPEVATRQEAFGKWSILDRELFRRGEYIQRRGVLSEVPYWITNIDNWALAKDPANKTGGRKIPLMFGTQTPTSTTSALLVDFEGGKSQTLVLPGRNPVVDESPAQALVLLPDGRLIARNSQPDTENEERKARVEEWRKFVKEVKSGRRNQPERGGLLGGGMPRGDGK